MSFDRETFLAKKNLLLLTIFLLSAGLAISYSFIDSDDADSNYDEIEGDRIEFNLAGNSSDVGNIDLKTDYLRVDGMRTLDSSELNLESDNCLRLLNYSGSVNTNDGVLQGEAAGFATCDVNGEIDIKINEEVDGLEQVSVDNLTEKKNFDLEIEDMEFNTNNFYSEVDEESANIRIRDYNGFLTLYPPNGIQLDGKAVVEINGELISES